MTDHPNTDALPLDQSSRPLWAPWRIEYIRGIKEGSCFICQAVENPGSAADQLVIARSEHTLLMLNAFPYNAGHVLVAPLRHVADLSGLEPAELSEMMTMLLQIKAVIQTLMAPDGFNVGFNLGAAAGAGLRDHVHGHIVPRWIGDTNFMPVLDGTRVVPEALAETAAMLREAWREGAAKS